MRGRYKLKKLAREAQSKMDVHLVQRGEADQAPEFQPFRDEAEQIPGLKRFRDDLMNVVRRRDLDALSTMLHDEVIWDIRGRGPTGLIAEMKEDPELWWDWEEALTPGGRLIRDHRNPKYRNSLVSPPYERDNTRWVSMLARVIRRDTPIYSTVDQSSIIGSLPDNQLVEVPRGGQVGNFHRIVTDKLDGYVRREDIGFIMPSGFEVVIQKIEGRWGVLYASNPYTW